MVDARLGVSVLKASVEETESVLELSLEAIVARKVGITFWLWVQCILKGSRCLKVVRKI